MNKNSAIKGLACLISTYMVSGCGEVIKKEEDVVDLSFLPSSLNCTNYLSFGYSSEDAVYKVKRGEHFCQTTDEKIGANVNTIYDDNGNLSEISYSRFEIVNSQYFSCTSDERNSECAQVFEEIRKHLENSEE